MDLAADIISGLRLDLGGALDFASRADTAELCRAADAVRGHFFGNKIETCSIVNARSGRCPENCKWCAQSAHSKTSAEVYPLMSSGALLAAAKASDEAKIERFSIVTSGRTLTDADVEAVACAFKKMRAQTGLKLCGSLGLLTKPQLQKLFEAGMTRYHCNLETAPSFFPKLCSTHTIQDKIRTINWAREVGLQICSGGIIGMGETFEQRVELAIALREVGSMSIPVNILNPIKGTPLENSKRLSNDEILRAFAMFRLINPAAHIRFAGGRILVGDLQKSLLKSGVSAAIVGDMLTTVGAKVSDDFAMFGELGYDFERTSQI
ncbi:MAG: biotin synthase BioB [Opitutales bacterium]|nr:biotin synthase BioB [Opitutales bacterium]